MRHQSNHRNFIEPLEDRCFLSAGPRLMENLGRGVVAVRASTTQALVSWRSLALDQSNLAFNVYRSANGSAAQKLNSSPLTGGTNFTDSTANFSLSNLYYVRPVLNGVEQTASGSFTLTANHAVEPMVRVPLRTPAAGYTTKFVWVGDLDGDGEYDYVIDRLAPFDPNNNDIGLGNQFIEAYKRDGTFLWSVDLGPTSTNTYNIEPGAATISVGNWDGVTVYDMDGDGLAEVLLKTANGVVFGDGQTLSAATNIQYISVLNGMTGAERARAQWGTDYLSDGSTAMCFGIGYLDGVHPSLVVKGKNRIGSGAFNMMVCAFSFNGSTITEQWKWKRGNTAASDGHQIRIVDVDGDGKDEFADIGFVLNSDGTMRYSLSPSGIAHGDRFHVADIDPARPGLEGYGVQQNDGHLGEPNRILEYYYDAANGQMLWTHLGTGADVGRGMAADIDPRFPGMEVWSFSGLFNAGSNQLTEPDTSLRPWPQLGLWWDGDLLHELLNDGKFEYWDWLNPKPTNSLPRFFRASTYGGVGSGVNPLMYGDIFGDWREEVIYTNSAQNELLIFSTNISSTNRIYTLAQNPAYRNGMTIKGYMQSHQLDYFLGDGMSTPPVPNIQTVIANPPPAAPTGLSANPISPTQVALAWNASASAATYNIKRSTVSGGLYTLIASNITSASYTDSAAAPGTTYFYVVSGVNALPLEGTNSAQASVSTPMPGGPIVYPAESASSGGGTSIDSNQPGFNGTGFANFPSNGGFLQFNNVTGGPGGTVNIRFRYALASGTRSGNLLVNGVSQPITFTSTGAWTTWSTLSLNVTLNPGGVNTIRLESTGQDLGNIDEMEVITDTGIPTVTNAVFNFTSTLHSIAFTMSENVNPSIQGNELVLTKIGGGSVGYTGYNYNATTNILTFLVPGPLADGNYRASFVPGSISDAAGNAVSSSYYFDFWSLAGDANRDRRVDIQDMQILLANWMQVGRNFSQGNFDYSGLVDRGDLSLLARNWQVYLAPAEPPNPPSPTSAIILPKRPPTRVISLI